MPLTDNESEFLDRVLLGNRDAVEFCEDLFAISQLWDDLVDGDKAVESETINAAFWCALVDLPNNPFYQMHFGTLQPLVQAAIVDWLDANDLEHGNYEARAAAYVLRDSVGAIVIHCARILGGYAHMRRISMEVRRALYDEALVKFAGARP